jgi:molybdopterin molybdotransferase
MGVELRISKVRIKPGKPFVFGVRPLGGITQHRGVATHVHAGLPKFIFGLPGNPVSGYVCTLRLASRLLTRMAGGEPVQELANATLQKPLAANGPREFCQPAVLDETGRIEPLDWRGSADIYTLAAANALIVREENAPALAAGASVRCMKMP